MIDYKSFSNTGVKLLRDCGIEVSREEEIEMFRAYKTESDQATKECLRDKIVRCYLRFVIYVAKGYSNYKSDLDDLICEGNIGLLNAIEKFDHDAGKKFITYAVWYINQRILKFLSADALIYIPNEVNSKYLKESKMEDFNPTDTMLDIHMTKNNISLDAPIESDDGHQTIGDLIPDSEHDSDTEEHNRYMVGEFMSTLNESDNELISMIFGINQEPISELDLAKKRDITKEGVRLAKIAALKKLKTASVRMNLKNM